MVTNCRNIEIIYNGHPFFFLSLMYLENQYNSLYSHIYKIVFVYKVYIFKNIKHYIHI